jgi:uncharacterized membrane protein
MLFPEIKSAKELLIRLSGLILLLFGVFFVSQLGVAEMIFGEGIANSIIYPIVGTVIQWLAIIAFFVIIGLMFQAVVSYIRNRGKPKPKSPELVAIEALTEKIDKLIRVIEERWQKNEQTNGRNHKTD